MKIAPIMLAVSIAFSAPAFAAGGDDSTRAGVRYSDLDLSTEAGQKALGKRLDKAARDVCGMDDVRTGTRVADREARSCFRSARASLDKQFATIVARQSSGG